MIKRDELANPQSCLNKARPDEPIFVLRAQDKLAAELVREWAIHAHLHGCSELKVQEALRLANAMEDWSPQKFPD